MTVVLVTVGCDIAANMIGAKGNTNKVQVHKGPRTRAGDTDACVYCNWFQLIGFLRTGPDSSKINDVLPRSDLCLPLFAIEQVVKCRSPVFDL